MSFSLFNVFLYLCNNAMIDPIRTMALGRRTQNRTVAGLSPFPP
jgi:hypothetical protein